MAISPDLCCAVVMALQNLIMITLLTRTPKGSFMRWICFPSMVYLAYLEGVLNNLSAATFMFKMRTGGHSFTFLIQLINLLYITDVDLTTLPNRSKAAFQLLLTIRGIGTPWQPKNIPPFPAVMQTNPPPGRTQYVVRQLAIIIWQGLFLRLLAHPRLHPDPSFYNRGREFSYRLDQWPGRLACTYIVGLIPSYLFLDMMYRGAAILFVGSGDHSVSQWPPLFGSLADSYTCRGFWGKFWHQYLRWPFSSFSTCVTTRILKLSRPSLVERYLNVFIVFSLSMIMHMIGDIVAGVEGGAHFGTALFFLSQIVAIMFEDTVQYVWRTTVAQRSRRPRGPAHTGPEANQKQKNGGVNADADAAVPAAITRDAAAVSPLWQRCVGFVWVVLWIAVSWSWWYYPIIRTMIKHGDLSATSSGKDVVPGWELPMVVGLVAGGAVLLRVVFKAEP
ncbi:hypothetical protein BO86DRAFT_121797 [Aspergillus japonicus CBS 114.51]|uniref:Wax synthase domain-containing protein n=2 Tax=Aspergillus TaxID=5052 RepID=A0A2V5GRG3_ASPV1|nr:hypothetical protein BO86DRAFT_121797 [Aspergillus japonicus CBS 114.51]PYI13578.1 hypothetical protein BO99DRAFT_438135 [Aspergillus violaceofuscus CBS 115571]RAH80681.1 hypothetical protein BO86DRAFT_121797 [Aspergillus japonicus CBS 114.51]